MVDVLAAFVICLLPFGLAALVIEGYLRMRDSYVARSRERDLIDEARLILRNPDAFTETDVAEAKRVLSDSNVVPFKKREAA